MTYDGDDHYTLSTGRRFYANNGILGIAPEDTPDAPVSYGADGAVYLSDRFEEEPNWTADEKRELADYMIAQWTAWREAIK